MWLDAFLAYLHYTAIFVLFAFMSCQLVMVRRPLDLAALRLLGRIDLWAAGAAMAALATGILRMAWGAKGADFYMSSWPFYVKVGLFVAVGLLTIKPTLAYIRWRRAAEHDASWTVPEAERKTIWRTLMLEIHLAAMIPVFAVVMARGLGR